MTCDNHNKKSLKGSSENPIFFSLIDLFVLLLLYKSQRIGCRDDILPAKSDQLQESSHDCTIHLSLYVERENRINGENFETYLLLLSKEVFHSLKKIVLVNHEDPRQCLITVLYHLIRIFI